VDTTKKYIRHLSLCTGYEGIGNGLRRVLPDVREIAYVEIETYAIANLVAKMETGEIHPAPVFTNLKEFPFRKFRGRVDILSGGFPCQPFSAAGKREGVEDPRHLFPYILEGIKECRPTTVFLENVEGIISSKTTDGESVLKYVLRSLEEVGYSATAGVFSAGEVGAPHQRKRVFIMAHSNSERCEGPKWESVQGEAREPSRHRVGQLAHSNSGRGREDWEQPELWTVGTEQPPTSTWVRSPEEAITQGQEGFTESWPARPNEEQYEWEEPRVLGDTINKGHESPRKEQQPEEDNCTDKQPKQTQPIMGGATDGASSWVDPAANRVDRLRLLGNGVVPQVAAKAFVVLASRLV
jgi:DNA (cytosine-5)-methyltransferase 1